MPEGVRVFAEEKAQATVCSMETIRSFVKQIGEMEDEIHTKREEIKQLTADFSDEYGIPKKEIKAAIRMLKSDVDPEIASEIYANIADLIVK